MKRQTMTYERAKAKHAGRFFDVRYKLVDTSYPHYEKVPVAALPAIFVWPDKEAARNGNEDSCVAVYWLRDED